MSEAAGTDRVIFVTGATGQQGGAVARHLLERGRYRVRAVTRDPSKPAARELAGAGADVVKGDLDDPETLKPLLDGVYGIFAVQDFWETGYEREVRQGKMLADLAAAADVRHFVYSSVGSAHRDTGIPHFESKWEIENHVRDLGLPYTIVRPVFFMDNWEVPMLRNMVLSGTLAQPLDPDVGFQQVAVDDVGAFVAMAFDDREEWLGRELDLAGDERTMPEIAEAFAAEIGRPVEYHQLSWDDYREAAGEEYAVMYRWFNDVGFDADIEALREIHPELTDFETYLRAHDWAGAQPAAEATAG